MSAISLSKSVRTCTIETGEAPRLESDRFLNYHNMMCPVWDGVNLKGQQVCPDSFVTKSRGCNSATDRVAVENDLRPDYVSYITLNAGGIDGNIYGNVDSHQQSMDRTNMLNSLDNNLPNYGKQFGASRRYTGCGVNAYANGMAQVSQTLRGQNAMQNGFRGYKNMSCSGMR